MNKKELSDYIHNPARNEGESYEEYKMRQKIVKKKLKQYLRGRK